MTPIKNLLFWTAIPFLIPQALYLRKTAPRFKPAGGQNYGSVGDGAEVRLLAIGDSIIAGVGASNLSKALVGQTATAIAAAGGCRVSWRALGVSGYDSGKVLERLIPKQPELASDYIVVSVGVNDITGLVSLRRWRRNLSLLLQKLQQHSPSARIAVAGIPPLHGFPLLPQPLRALFGMRGRVFDEALKEIVRDYPGSMHVPLDFDTEPDKFAADGYHPSEESYTEFGQHMAEALFARKLVHR